MDRLVVGVLIAATACGGSSDSVTGFTQKGPYVIGSSITAQELDDQLQSVGNQFSTETTDDFGAFAISSHFSTRHAEIIGNGFYYDEVGGALSPAPLTLRTIADLDATDRINVNLLTDLEEARLVHLVDGGMDFASARAEAQHEVLAVFGIDDTGLVAFDQMDVAGQGDGDAVLLAVSALLQELATTRNPASDVAELSSALATIAADLESDGTLDDAGLRADLVAAGIALDLGAVRQNLEARYAGLGRPITAPAFEGYVDSDGDGLLNKDDDDTPDPFTFTPQRGVAPATEVESNEVTIGGIGSISGVGPSGFTRLSVTDGTLVVNGADAGMATTVVAGDRLAVKVVSSAVATSATVTAMVTVGSVERGFAVSTLAANAGPDQGVPRSAVVTLDGSGSADPDQVLTYQWSQTAGPTVILSDPSAIAPTFTAPDALVSFTFQLVVTDDQGHSSSDSVVISVVPTLVGHATVSGSAIDADVVGNYAYVTDATNGLVIYDISNPAAPTQVGNYNTPAPPEDITVAGTHAYACDGQSIVIVDVSNPAAPTLVSNTPLANCRGIVVVGTLAYVTASPGLVVLDVSNPATPTVLGSVTTPNAVRVAIDAQRAYLTEFTSGVQVIDVTNPAAMTILGTFTYSFSQGSGAELVAESGGHAYVSAAHDGLLILDVTDPTQPTLIGRLSLSANLEGTGLALANGLVYMAALYDVLWIDPGDGTTPQVVTSYVPPLLNTAQAVAVVGEYVLISEGSYGIEIVR